MLPIEQAALVSLGIVGALLIARKRRAASVAMIIAAGFVGCQLVMVGEHWQMYPGYMATLLLVAGVLGSLWISRMAWVLPCTAFALLGASAGMAIAVPMFQLPAPTGPHAVGTAEFHLVDPARRETHANDKNQPRELNVQIWYPANSDSGRHARYRQREETTFLSSYQSVLQTRAIENAAIARTAHKKALLLFNPAWQGYRTQNTALAIELASHGFVVASVDHAYNSIRTAFPDGRVIVAAVADDLDDFSRVGLASLWQRADAELRVQTLDDEFVLNTLLEWNADPSNFLYEQLDAKRIATLGHSFGGAVAIQTALTDPRVRTAVDLDGWVFGDLVAKPMGKPLLAITEDEAYPTRQQLSSSDAVIRGKACYDGVMLESLQRSFAEDGGYLVTVRGAKHMDFSDRPFLSPFRSLTSAGKLPPRLVSEITSSYIKEFLQQALYEVPSALLGGSERYGKQVLLQAWRPHDPRNPVLVAGSWTPCITATHPGLRNTNAVSAQ